MKFLDNLKMGPKLIAAFVLTALFAVMVGLFAINKMQIADDANTMLFEKGAMPLAEWMDISNATYRIRTNMKDILLGKDFEAYEKRINDRAAERTKSEAVFEKGLVSDEAKALWKRYKENQAGISEGNKKIRALVKAGKRADAEALAYGEIDKLQQEQNKIYEEMQQAKVNLSKKIAEDNTKNFLAAKQAMYFMMAIAAALAVALGVIIARSIAQPMKKGVDMMNEMALGHLGMRLRMERKDEIGDLARAMDDFSDDLQLNTVGTLKKIAVGDLSTDVKAKDAQDEISPAMAQATTALRNMSAEAQRLAQAAIAGKLATRADASQYQGEYRKIVAGVNETLDAVIGPLNVAAGYVDRISKGDIPPKITDSYNGDFNEIKNNLNQCVDAVNALVNDAVALAKAGVEGRLATRADATKHQGDFRKIVQGVNDCLDAVIGPLNVAAGYVDRISKGDIPPKITDTYNGDFNEIKNNLNQCIDAIVSLIDQTGLVIDAAKSGKLATRVDADKAQGAYRKILRGMNETLDAVIGPLNVAAGYVDRISKGDIPPKITDNYNGDFNEIKNNLNQCVDALNGLIAEMNHMSAQHDAGDIDIKIDANRFLGAYKAMATGVNDMVFGHIAVKKKAMACVMEFGKGNFEAPLETFPGKKVFINNTIEQVRSNLKALIADASMLSNAAVEGRLTTRADASRHEGDFRKIVQGVNSTLDAVIGPLNVAAGYVDQISKGIIPPKITDTYNGDFNTIKNNLNQCIDGLQGLIEVNQALQCLTENDFTVRVSGHYLGVFAEVAQALNDTIQNQATALKEVQESSFGVAQSSGEIASGNQELSSRTEQQAANLEETASSMEEFTSTVTQTAESARSASGAASQARVVADEGSKAVEQLVTAMDEINAASARINEIIGVVDEIAFQTNLLALNAAVEAARAGEQGRGFAVVAAEVRNLAKRSADSAKEIKSLIKDSVTKAQEGQKVATRTGQIISDVVTNVSKVTELIQSIANATNEQTSGINEINRAIAQMDEVTQQNAALVEETAAAAESLNDQAQTLRQVVARYKLGNDNAGFTQMAARAPKATLKAPVKQQALARPKRVVKGELSHSKPPVAPPKDEGGEWESF